MTIEIDNQIAHFDCLPERAGKMELGTTRCISQRKFPRKPHSESFIDQACSAKMARHWPHSFSCDFMDRDEVSVHKLAKKRTRPISSHLYRTSLVNEGFSIWLSGKFLLRDTTGSPERGR